jgi:hypothetical protein
MSKRSLSASRFIIACAVLVVAACFGSCSTKSQLVGKWRHGGFGPEITAMDERWVFRSDDTCEWGWFTREGQCKYTVLDDGSIKIDIQGGDSVTGKIENGNLIINWSIVHWEKQQTSFHKM